MKQIQQTLRERRRDMQLPPGDPRRDVQTKPAGGDIGPKPPPPIFSADGKHIAYIVKTARGVRMFRDGKADQEFDEIATSTQPVSSGNTQPVFSADGARLVYAARKGKQWFAVVDGKTEGPYDTIGINRWDTWNMLGCSPDGKHVWYSALTGGDLRVVTNGKEGPVLLETPVMRTMPNGNVYYTGPVKGTGKYVMVVNGKVVGEYDGLRWLEPYQGQTSIGRRAAYAVKRGKKWFPVILGKELKSAYIIESGPVYSPDRTHFAYVGIENGKQFIVVDGKRGASFKHIWGIRLRNSGQVHYLASEERYAPSELKVLIVGDKRVLEFYTVRKDGARTVRVVDMDPPNPGKSNTPSPLPSRLRVLHRGVVDEGMYNVIKPPIRTHDGERWAYAALRGRTWYLVVNGKAQAQAKDVDDLAITDFLTDGRLVYRTKKDDVVTVFVGEKSAPEAWRHFFRLTKDSAHAVWVNKVGKDEEVLIIDGVPGPKFRMIRGLDRVRVSTSGRYATYMAYPKSKAGDARWVLVSGDRIICDKGRFDVVFGPGDRLVHVVYEPNGKCRVFVDEKFIGQYDSVTWRSGYSASVFFSPDGRHYAFRATKGSGQMMVIDGIEGPEFELIHTGNPIESPPTIGPTSVTYWGMRKGKLCRISTPLARLRRREN